MWSDSLSSQLAEGPYHYEHKAQECRYERYEKGSYPLNPDCRHRGRLKNGSSPDRPGTSPREDSRGPLPVQRAGCKVC
jgi:hypothetical protein